MKAPDEARHLSAPRGRQQFRRRARRCVSRPKGPKAVDFFTSKTALRVRHAADLSRLPRRSAGRHAGRPLDGDAAVRRPRTRRAHQGYRPPLPELTVFGMMLGSGKEIIHFMRATKSLASAVYVAKAAVETLRWTCCATAAA